MSRTKNIEIKIRIMEAAMKLFCEYGFKKATVNEIAAAAGIGKGTVYLHFKTKEQLLCEIARVNAEESLRRLSQALEKIEGPEEKLRFALKWRPESVYKFRDMHRHAMELLPEARKEMMRKIGAGPMKQYIGIFQDILEEGIRKGVFYVQSVRAAAEHINYMGFAFMPPYRVYETKKEILGQVSAYADMLVRSISLK